MGKIVGICLLCILVATLNAGAQETPRPRRIIPIGNLEILGTYSDIDKGADLWGFNISGSFSPATRLNDTQYLIPLYSGAYKRLRQYVTQEEGGRLYNTWQIHNGSLALRTKHSDKLTSRLTAIGTWNFVKETKDESFGKGLYDYRDFGGNIDLRYTNPQDDERQRGYTAGFQYFRREYPNYKSLISLATQTAVEENEKDFDGIKFSTGIENKNTEGLNWEFKPSLLLKYFIDKRLIGEDGVLNMDKKRMDYAISVGINGMYPLKRDVWEMAIDNSIDYNHSNIGFYDSRDTTGIGDDVFTKNYYTYLSLVTYPYLTYYHPIGRDKRISIRGGYSFLLRDYPDRKARNSDGTYTSTDERDKEHAAHFLVSYPITKEIAWVTKFDYTFASSNQEYEKYYRYEYDVYQVQAGISISF